VKIIIFGGNGFIGKHLHKRLMIRNKVYSFGNKKYSNSGKNLVLYNKSNFLRIFKNIKPDVIFFLSGNSYPNNTINDENYDFETNNIILQQLLSALIEIKYTKLFLYTSSIAVYGNIKTKKSINEKHKLDPLSFYGSSKLIAEKQIEFISKKCKFKSIVLRLSSIYGPGLRRQIVYQILKQATKGKPLILNGSILDSRQFLYVEDCVEMFNALIYLKHSKFEIFNISFGNKIKIIDIINYAQIFLRKKIKTKFLNIYKTPNLPALSNKKFIKKVKKNIKFTKFKFGLIETLNWIKKIS